MSEQNPEQGQDYDKSFRELMDSPEGVPLISKLTGFDSMRGALYHDLAQFAANIDEINMTRKEATIEINDVAEQFAGVLKEMVKGAANHDDIVDMASRLMLKDSTERVEMMNGLVDGLKMLDFKPDDLTDVIAGCVQQAETTNQAIENIEQMYRIDLTHDVEIFVQLLIQKKQQSIDSQPQMMVQTLEIKKDLKDHIGDIAKVALGVTVALAFDRLFHKKT